MVGRGGGGGGTSTDSSPVKEKERKRKKEETRERPEARQIVSEVKTEKGVLLGRSRGGCQTYTEI